MIPLLIFSIMTLFLAYYAQKGDFQLIVTIILVSWVGGSFVGYQLWPGNSNDLILTLFPIVALLSKAMNGERIRAPLIYIFLLFMLSTVVSTIVNESGFLRWALFVRYFLMYYLFLLVFVNSKLTKNHLIKINKLLVYVILLQILVATIKWMVLPGETGEFGQEAFTGTYAVSGGSPHVLITLIGFGFLLPAYIINPKREYLIYMMLFVWFVLVGGKRAIIVILPILCFFIFFVMNIKRTAYFKKILPILGFLMISIPLITSLNYTLNPEGKVGGSIDFTFLIGYIVAYEMGAGYLGTDKSQGEAETEGFYAVGRLSSTYMFFDNLSYRDQLLFGIGTGKALKSGIVENRYRRVINDYGVDGGVTGMTWMLLQIGLFGALSYFLIFLKVFFMTLRKSFQIENNPSHYLFSMGLLGMCFTFIFDYLSYSEAMLRGEYFYVLFFYLVYLVHFSNDKLFKEV